MENFENNRDYFDHKFENCDFLKELEDSNFKKCIFKKVNFTDCDLSSLYFENCKFIQCDFSNCVYSKFASKGNTYFSCKLMGLNFTDSHLDTILFEECYMKYSNFAGCILNKVCFSNCDLEESGFISLKKFKSLCFRECNLKKADFYGTKLDQLDFRTCDISYLKVRLEDLRGMVVTSLQALNLATILGIDIKEIDEDICE